MITSYSGRTLDLLALEPTNVGKRSPVSMSLSGKVASGVQKSIQQWTVLLLTRRGTVKADPTYGSSFIPNLMRSNISEDARTRDLFGMALQEVQSWIQANVDFTDKPDDEIITGVNLHSLAVADGTAVIVLRFRTRAGTSVDYLVPVSYMPVTGA